MEIKTKLRIELGFISLLCIVAVAAMPLSLVPCLRPCTETLPLWFQRSGSITSMFAMYAQYQVSNFGGKIQGGTYGETWGLFHLFKNHHAKLSWIVTCVGILGASVWGYGDLLIK